MISEVNEAQAFFNKKFGKGKHVPAGTYAVPTNTSRGKAFMGVEVTDNQMLRGFYLWWDEDMKISWYDCNKDGTSRYDQ